MNLRVKSNAEQIGLMNHPTRFCSVSYHMALVVILVCIVWALPCSVNPQNDIEGEKATYPWWVTDDAVAAARSIWESWFYRCSNPHKLGNFALYNLAEVSEVEFRYPHILFSVSDIANYTSDANVSDHILFTNGYGFRIYHNGYYIGGIEIYNSKGEWKYLSAYGYQKQLDESDDALFHIYSIYDAFSNPDIVLAGGRNTFIIISGSSPRTILEFDTETHQIVEQTAREYLLNAHNNYLKTQHLDPKIDVEAFDVDLPIWKKWNVLREEITIQKDQ